MNTYRRFSLSDDPRDEKLIARDLGSPTSYIIGGDSKEKRKKKARKKIDKFHDDVEIVYHVSNKGDGKSGILSGSTMEDFYPEAWKFMNATDTDYMQYDNGDDNVIIKREPADKFKNEAIE